MNDSGERNQDSQTVAPRKRTPLPKLQLFILLAIQFAEPITALVIYPFVVQFVRDTGVTGGDEVKTGFYAGLLESAFFLAESLTVFQFGRLSDIYGRRPVLLIAPLGLAITMFGFGLSTKFWNLFMFRCAQGAFNGNIGVSKTVMNEISDPTNVADIFSLGPMMWSLGVTISPFMGGVLSNPATKWPDTLGKISLLRKHPYFLPCAVAAGIAFSTFILAFIGLRETLPSALQKSRKQKSSGTPTETEPLLPAENIIVLPQPADTERVLPIHELLTRPVCIALLNHGLLGFCDMAYEALLPLVYATPIELGGLGLKPHSIGLIMGLCGVCNAVIQALLGGRLIRYVGARRVFTASFCAIICAIAAYPLLNVLARRAGRVDHAVLLVMVMQLSCSVLMYFAFAATMIFIMDAAPNRANVGSVSGLAQMVCTILRAAAPSCASSLFALSVQHNLLGGYLVYPILCTITLGAVGCSLLLPRK